MIINKIKLQWENGKNRKFSSIKYFEQQEYFLRESYLFFA